MCDYTRTIFFYFGDIFQVSEARKNYIWGRIDSQSGKLHSSILLFGFKPDSERFYASPARERSTVPTAGGIEEGVQGGCLPVMGTAGRDLLTPSPEHRHKPGPQPIDEP